MTLTIAFNYGGRAEIVDAVRALVAEGTPADKIDEKAIRRHLYDPEMPDPDLVIRTSGEYRISNFLLWELAYSELVFTDVLWPDFRREHLFEAVREYQRRDRRFGGVESSRATVTRSTATRASCCAPTSWARPTASSCSCTRGHGKVRAVAKGVRKTKSKFGARLEPHEPRRACSSTRAASSTSSPRPSRSTTSGRSATTSTASTRASPCSRRSTRWPRRARPNPRLYQMLLGAPAHARPPTDSPLLRAGAFFWKLLAAEGCQPELDALRECGSPEPLVAFDLDSGGVLCRTCRRGVPRQPGGGRPAAAHPRRRSSVAALAEPASPATHEVDAPGQPRPWSTTSSAGCESVGVLDQVVTPGAAR